MVIRKTLSLRVNGIKYEFEIEPRTLLVDLLREELGLKGTKKGCASSSCATCTVLLDGMAVKSCSILAMQANNKDVVTIEGLAEGEILHPIQDSFVKNHGLACGYCTPGMIMATAGLLKENGYPKKEDVVDAINGHLCRCGTYPKIIKSVLEAAERTRGD